MLFVFLRKSQQIDMLGTQKTFLHTHIYTFVKALLSVVNKKTKTNSIFEMAAYEIRKKKMPKTKTITKERQINRCKKDR